MALVHYVYLHGFASSPASGKAVFLAERLAGTGVVLHRPDLNAPDFSTLTVTRMIDRTAEVVRALPPAPVVVIGSSLGAFVALHLAERRPGDTAHPLHRMVWLAPALAFGTAQGWLDDAAVRRWRETGWLEVMHHAYGETRRVHAALWEDARRYDSLAVPLTVPTLIVQGRDDDVVDPAMVARFAADRPQARLVMMADGHQLSASLPRIWDEIQRFAAPG